MFLFYYMFVCPWFVVVCARMFYSTRARILYNLVTPGYSSPLFNL